MELKPGVWVDLGDHRIAMIDRWDEEAGTAVAETPTGALIERPITFARSRWRPMPEDGLRVAAAIDEDGVRRRAEDAPVEIILLALRDLDGRGETQQLRNLISPLVIAESDWERWWRRAQVRFEDDDRIDASRARHQVYALARPGSTLGRALVPALQEEMRRSRRMADGPQLKRARDRARQKSAPTPDDEALFRVELAVADEPSADPTDRFMAAELGVWLGRWSADEAKAKLGDDIRAVDLLRIPAHASRSLALEWALGAPDAADSITCRSAMAAGAPWSEQVLSSLAQTSTGLRQATFGVLGWSVPGDEDAGPAKLKEDLPTFERRIESARTLLATLPSPGRLGLFDGALHALRALPRSGIYGAQVARIAESIARLAWSALQGIAGADRPRLGHLPPMDRDAFAPLVRTASSDDRTALRAAAISWYADDPATQFANLRLIAESLHEDVLTLGLEASQRVIRKTTLPRLAAHLFHEAADRHKPDALTNAVVNLAVTTIGDDPTVNSAMDRLAEAIVEGFTSGAPPVEGPLMFTRAGWDRFGRLVALRLTEATSNEAAARERADAAFDEARQARELAEQRSETLASALASASTDRGQDVVRLASNLLRPVALAVADSYEAANLDALQDRLLAVLQRARIVPIHEIGEVAVFDSTRHQWVGDGSPTDRVEARSPGFLVLEEGGDELVLVPARVVAAGAS